MPRELDLGLASVMSVTSDDYQPTTTQTKLDTLQQNKQTKLSNVFKTDDTFTSDVLLGMEDADTEITKNLGDVRDQSLYQSGYDAVETGHGGRQLDVQKQILGSRYKAVPQTQQVATLLGKNPADLTTEDYAKVGEWQKVMKLHQLAGGSADDTNAPELKDFTGRVEDVINVSGKGYRDEYGRLVDGNGEIPLNVDIMSREVTSKYDTKNRTSGQLGSIDGINVSETAAADVRQNALASAESTRAEGDWSGYQEALSESRKGDLAYRVGNTIKGVAAGAFGGVYDLVDLGAELFGGDLGSDEEKTKAVDELTGYNRFYTSEAGEVVKEKITEMSKNGVTGEGVFEVLKEGFSNPEFLGESVGWLLPMMFGGVVSAGGKGVAAATKAVQAAEKTGDAAKVKQAVEALDKAKEVYGSLGKSVDFITKNAGLLGVSAGETSDSLDAYAKEAGISKGDVSAEKMLGTYLATVVKNGIDRWSDISILKGPEVRDGLVGIIKGATNKQIAEIGKGLGRVGAGVVIQGGKESGTEYIQTFIEQVNEQVGEQAGKTLLDAWNSEANEMDRLTGAALGFTGAQQMNVASVAVTGANKGLKAGKDAISETFKQPEPQPVDEEAKKKAEEWLTRDLTKKQESYPEPANEVEKTILENVKGLNEEDFVKVQEEVTQELEAINSKDELTEEETTYKANLEATLKYVNARKENEAVNKKVDTVVAKVGNLELNQAQLEQTRQAYANQEQFEEKIEPMKNIAMEVVKKGNVDVLGSDLDTKVRRERIAELVELLSMDEDLDAGTLDALVAKMGGTKEDKDAVNSAVDSGKLMKKLMSEVAGEVATGNRGFLTYYNNIRTAREQGDTKAELDNKVKMAKFIDSQSNKLARMEEAEKEFFEEELRNAKIDAKNLGISVEEVLKKKEAQYKKSKKSVEVKYDTRQPAIKMSRGTMLEYLNLGKPADFKGGIYKLKNGIKEELDAMTQLYAKVNGDEVVSKPEKKEVPKKEKASKKEVREIPVKLKEAIDKDLNEGMSIDEVILKIDTAPKLSNETKAAAAEYARNYKVPKKEEKSTAEEMDVVPEISTEQPGTLKQDKQLEVEVITEQPKTDAPKEMDVVPETPMDVPSDFNAAMDLATQEEASIPMDIPQDVFTAPQEEMQVPTNEVEIKEAVKSSVKGPEELKRIYEIRDELEARIDEKIVNNEDPSALEANLNLVKKGLDGSRSALQKWIESNDLARFKPWAGESNAKGRLLKDFFKVGRLTGINYREVKADEGLRNEVVELLKVTTGKRSADDGANDIGRNLLFDERSNVNDMTVIAIDKALKNYLAENAGELGQKPEMEDILDMLPHMRAKVYSKDMVVAFEAEQALENFFRSGGGLLKFEAEKIGADIMADLGIVAGPNTPETVVQAMKASLGGMAITLGVNRGQFKKIEGFGAEKAKVPFLKVEKKTGMKWGDRLQDYKNASEAVNAQYDVDGSRKNSWKTTPNRRQREVEIKNMPYSKANPTQKNFKNDLAEMEWKPNSGIDVMIEMFGKDKEGLKAILGKKTDIETKKLNFDDRSAQESKNMEVDTEVDSLFDMLEKTKTEEEYASVWFDYFLAKNGRTNMKSITVNPQTNKKLNRFLVTVLDANTEVTVAEINEAKSKKGIGFLYGIVQGFEQKGLPEIDSASQKDIIEAGKELLAKTDKELVEMVKKSAHPGHAMLAVANIRKMREAKNGKFESDLVLETDGLTNGLFFKFLQFPTQKVMQLLDKVGILLKGSKFFDANTMAEVKGSKKNDKGFRENGFLDMYESIGNNFVVPKLKGRNAEILKLAKKALLDMTDKKAVRQLAKSPVMVTGYSAGEESTKRNVVKERLKDFATAVTKGKISDENLAKLFPGVDVKGLLMEHSMFSKELDKVRKDMEVFFMEYYAEPIYKALEEELGELKEIGDTVTEAYNYVYKVMNLEYVKRMAKVVEANQKNPDRRGLNGLLTEQERIDLIKGMIKDKIGPFVATSETTVDEDMLVVLSRGLRDIEEEIQKAGIRFDSKELKVKLQVRDGKAVSKLGEDVKTVGIQLVMRGVGTPGAAGGVLQTHSEDNHVMARIFAKRKDKFSQVFDAQVLGIGQLDAVKSYNEEAFELNREFSMLDAVLDAMEATLKSDSVVEVDKQQLAEKSKTGSEIMMKLSNHKVGVDELRGEIFTSEAKIGQMVGPDGLMHEVNPKKELDKLMDRKKGIAKRLEGISKYLGKNGIPVTGNRISSIMKKNGCK